MDYYLNIYKNNEYLFTIGGKHMDYDNVIWWELEDIKNIKDIEKLSKEELIKTITKNSSYFVFVRDDQPEEIASNMDIQLKTIELDELVPLFNFDEELPCIKVINRDGEYFARYPEGDEYPMIHVNCDYLDLLYQKNLSFDEFEKLFKFVDYCVLTYDDTDFIVNNKVIMRFNFA